MIWSALTATKLLVLSFLQANRVHLDSQLKTIVYPLGS